MSTDNIRGNLVTILNKNVTARVLYVFFISKHVTERNFGPLLLRFAI